MTDTASAAVSKDQATNVKSRRGRRVLGLVLALLVLLLGMASYLLYQLVTVPARTQSKSAAATGLTWVRSIYGMSDSPDAQLDGAEAAVPAADGSIWVADGKHALLSHFTPDGRFIGTLTGPVDKPLNEGRFAIDANGTFYVVETIADTVRVFDATNRDRGSFGIPKPVSVAVSDDRIVVGAVSGFAILDKTGKPIKVVGSRGKEDYQFDYAHGVAIARDGTIYVVDSYNNRLSAYTKDGKRLWIVRTGRSGNSASVPSKNGALAVPPTTDSKLAEKDQMQLPLGMTIDGAGRLVVVDMFDCSLNVFNPKDGSFIGKYGDAGADDGAFFYPVSVGYDAQRDWFTVADSLNNRVEIVRLPGSAGGNQAVAAVNRTFAGPLRACLLPFLVLLLAIIIWLVTRAARKRRQSAAVQAAPAVATVQAADDPESMDPNL